MKALKNLIYILPLGLLALTGCRELESEDVSRTTTYPVFTFNGDETLTVEQGDEYSDPGVTAKEGETDIPIVTSVEGTYFGYTGSTLNTSMLDIYTITYAATNSDGFDGLISRTVYVVGQGNLTDNLEGVYTATVTRNGAGGAAYTDREYVFINKTGENTYELSDGIGGYYDFGREYGPGYAAPGATFTANDIAANDFTMGPDFTVGTFGGTAELNSVSVNAGNKTVHFTSTWDTGTGTVYSFDVTLKQVQY